MDGDTDYPNNRRREACLESLDVEDLELLSNQIQNAIIEARRNCEIIDKLLEDYFTGSKESLNLSDHEVSDHENALVEINLENCSVWCTSVGNGEKCHSGYYARDSVEFEEMDSVELTVPNDFSNTQAVAENDGGKVKEVSVNLELLDPVYAIPPQTSASARRDVANRSRFAGLTHEQHGDGVVQSAADVENVGDDRKPLVPKLAPEYVLYEFPNLDRYFLTMMAICIALAMGFLWIFIGSILH